MPVSIPMPGTEKRFLRRPAATTFILISLAQVILGGAQAFFEGIFHTGCLAQVSAVPDNGYEKWEKPQ
jgi:hypothetical protein